MDAQRSLLEEKALQEERQKRVHEQNELAKRADMKNAQTQMLEQQRMRLAEETKKIEEPPPTTDMPIKYEESSNIAVNNAELSSSDIPEPTEPPKVNHEESSERVPAATMVPSIPEHEELSLYTPSNLGGHSAPNTPLDINSLRPTELFLSPSSSPEGSKVEFKYFFYHSFRS